MKRLTIKACCALAVTLLAGSAQAQFTYQGGNLNEAQTYDGLGVDSGLNPYTLPTFVGTTNFPIGDGGWAGRPAGSLTVLSGTLNLNANDCKIGTAGGGGGSLILGTNAALNINMIGQWGVGIGVAWAAGTVIISNNATLNLLIDGTSEQRLLLGDDSTRPSLTLYGGAMTVTHGTNAFTDGDRGFSVRNADINLDAGTLTYAMELPFFLGGQYINMNSTPYANHSVNTSVMNIGNGSFVMTTNCAAISANATFRVGNNSYVKFTGGTGSLSLKDWTLSDYTALVNSGRIRVGFVGGPSIQTTMDSFDFSSLGGQGILTAKPFVGPTAVGVVTQIVNATVYEYTEASFTFVATNNGTPLGAYGMTYEWYKNDALVSTNAMGPRFTFLTTPADSNAQIYAVARVADTNYSVAVTSAVATLTVNPGSTVYTNGLKREFFAGAGRQAVEIGNVGPGVISMVSQADTPSNLGDNYAARFSGYFISPADNAYVFFVAADDDTDLFLSTDSSPANKQLIAQEYGWSGTRNWQTAGGGGSIVSQKRSDQWTNSAGVAPYASGIYLLAGQKYYFESVMHQGGGGDNWAITYVTTNELALDPGAPANGTGSRLTAANQNIALVTWAGTNITWVTQPHSAAVNEGASTNFTCLALTDAEMLPDYQWYLNDAPAGNGTSLNLATIPFSLNHAQIKVVASTKFGGLSITSSVVTLDVIQAVWEPGFAKVERWDGATRLQVEAGTVGTPAYEMAVPAFGWGLDNPNGPGNVARRVSGYFVPPSTDPYTFFINTDDSGDLFFSTNSSPASKQLIAQEVDWSEPFRWTSTGGPWYQPSDRWYLKRSDQWTNSSSGGIPPFGSGFALTAGNKYYMEIVEQNGGAGGANCAATYKLAYEGDPAIGADTRMKGNRIGIYAVRCSYVAFTQQPASVTAPAMGYVTFSAAGTTDSTLPIGSVYGIEEGQTNLLFLQWQKNGVDIPGANSGTLRYGPLTASDDGAQIVCRIRALGYADNSLNRLWSNSTPATITLSPKAVFEPGYVWVDWWSNTTSKLAVENYTATAPHFSYVAPKFAGPMWSSFDNFVNKVSALFVAPATSNYVFYVSSDDDSDLFLSTDSNAVNKRLIAQETGWSGAFSWNSAGGGGSAVSQKRSDSWSPDGAGGAAPYSAGIPLIGGQQYWLEGVHHEGAYGDHFAATFDYLYFSPTDGDDTKFAGDLIGTYVPQMPWVAFLQEPTGQTATSGGNPVTFTVQGTNPPTIWIGTTGNPNDWLTNPPTLSLQYQWYKNGTPIPGATGNSYTQPYVLPSDQNAQFVCGLRALGYADEWGNRIYSNSAPAVLTVVTDTVPPTLTYAATFVNTNPYPPLIVVNVTFSEWMDSASLLNPANYSIGGGVNITNISIGPNHRTAQLVLDAEPTLPLTVTVSNMKDLSGNALTGSPTTAINPETLTFSDVGTPGSDPAYPSFIWVYGQGGYLVSAQGHDIWDAYDGFNFGWELKTNDFDVVVRCVKQDPTSAWAKMGLMVRESLDASTRNWHIVNEPLANVGGANRIEAGMRDSYAAASTGTGWQIGTLPAPAYPNAWLRLTRVGEVLRGFYATNGVDWVLAAAYDASTNAIPLTNVVYVGLCTTAHNNDAITYPPPTTFLYYNTAEYADYNSSYVLPTPPQLSISLSGNNVIISWTPAGGHLESSPAISGPGVNWQTVGASNPGTIAIGAGPVFFRVVNP